MRDARSATSFSLARQAQERRESLSYCTRPARQCKAAEPFARGAAKLIRANAQRPISRGAAIGLPSIPTMIPGQSSTSQLHQSGSRKGHRRNSGFRGSLQFATGGSDALRPCSPALTCNPLLDEQRAVDQLDTVRFTQYQESNAGSIQEVDILQVKLWRACASFNLYLQTRQTLLLNPAAQLKNSRGRARRLVDA